MEQPSHASAPPPEAFVQGVGTVFQVVGGTLFLTMMLLCCFSGMLPPVMGGRDVSEIGWRIGQVFYSGRTALILGVFGTMVLGLALASLGLGLQALKRPAVPAAAAVSLAGAAFWMAQTIFFISMLPLLRLILPAAILTAVFAALAALSLTACLQRRREGPMPAERLWAPASGPMEPQSPAVELADEIQFRRQRLEIEQKEVEALERRLKRRLEEHGKGP